jgi:hypothetical protein
MLGWVKIVAVEHLIFHQTIERVFVRLYPEAEDLDNIDLDPSIHEEIQAPGGDASVFCARKMVASSAPAKLPDIPGTNHG